MEIILEFLDRKVEQEFRALSKEDLGPASTALSVFLKKRLMETISNSSKQKILEVVPSETFDEEKCQKVLEFLTVDFKSLSNVLHSGELVVCSVYQTLKTLSSWGAVISFDQAVGSLWALHQRTNMIQQYKKETNNSMKVNKTTNSAIAKNEYSDRVSLEDLIHLPMENLILFKTHRGCYIKGQLVGYSVVTTGVTQLLSDDKGHFITIGIYNLSDVKTNDQFEHLYPRGTWIKIKEPYFKIFDNGERGVRVDAPSDIEASDANQQEVVSVKRTDEAIEMETNEFLKKQLVKVKTRGNQLFVEKQFNQALQTYLSGITSTKNYMTNLMSPLISGETPNGSSEHCFINYIGTSLMQLVGGENEMLKPKNTPTKKGHSIMDLLKSRKHFYDTKPGSLQDKTSKYRQLLEFLEKCIEFGLICSNISICYKELKFYKQSSIFARVVCHFNVAESIKQKCSRRDILCQFLCGERKKLTKVDAEWYGLKEEDIQYFGQLEQQASIGESYNWDKIMEQYIQPNTTSAEFDVADYKGPIEFKEIPGKGIGTVARQPFKKGQLVMVSKALWQRKRDDNERVSDTVSCQLTLSGPQVQLARDIALRCKSDEGLRRKLMTLFSSPKFNRLKYQDVLHAEGQNGFKETEGIEVERVAYAVKFNTFGSNASFLAEDCNSSTVAGLWFEPSFFNHDDNPNVCWAVIGNLMVARACSDIEAGEELTITYTCELRYAERQATLNSYGFEYKIDNIPGDVIKSIADASNKVTELKLSSQKARKDKQKQEHLNKAIALNNSTIEKFHRYLSKNQPLHVSLLYDQMDLYLAAGNYQKAKISLITILNNHVSYVNEDLLKTAFSSFPKLDSALLNYLEEVSLHIYGTRNLPQIYLLYKIKAH